MKKVILLALVLFTVAGCGRKYVVMPRGNDSYDIYARSGKNAAVLEMVTEGAKETCGKKNAVFQEKIEPEQTGRNLYEVNTSFKCE